MAVLRAFLFATESLVGSLQSFAQLGMGLWPVDLLSAREPSEGRDP
nr:hypothetical protein [Ferrimicrobium sp.]